MERCLAYMTPALVKWGLTHPSVISCRQIRISPKSDFNL